MTRSRSTPAADDDGARRLRGGTHRRGRLLAPNRAVVSPGSMPGEASQPRLRAVDPQSPAEQATAAAADAKSAADEVSNAIGRARGESVSELAGEVRRLAGELL